MSIPKGHSVHDLEVFAGGWLAAKVDGQIIGKDDDVRTVEKKIRLQYRAIDIQDRVYVSAYAFNGDGIKSETDRKLDFFLREPQVRQKVTILSVGVNEYADARVRALKYAAADAEILNGKLAASLAKAHPDALIEARTMISDGTRNLATKAAFVAELRSLGARRSADSSAQDGVAAKSSPNRDVCGAWVLSGGASSHSCSANWQTGSNGRANRRPEHFGVQHAAGRDLHRGDRRHRRCLPFGITNQCVGHSALAFKWPRLRAAGLHETHSIPRRKPSGLNSPWKVPSWATDL